VGSVAASGAGVDVEAVGTASARMGALVFRCDSCTALATVGFRTTCLVDRRATTRDAMAKPSSRTLELEAKLFIVE